jgi:Tol biopolymer transport system component
MLHKIIHPRYPDFVMLLSRRVLKRFWIAGPRPAATRLVNRAFDKPDVARIFTLLRFAQPCSFGRGSTLRPVAAVLGLLLAVRAFAVPLDLASPADSSIQPPAGGGGDSWKPVLSPDGRFVLFASTANNLVLAGTNTSFLSQMPGNLNVFLRDRTNGTTTLVSINLAGTGGGNDDSIPTGLSTNGQFALFESTASDLVPGDTNKASDVFLRDLVGGTTTLVSPATSGGCASGASSQSVMTPDGRHVAFSSLATNLVADDTNGIADIFVRDRQTGLTVLASPGATLSGSVIGSSSDSPQITPDGRYVAFFSSATNLVPQLTVSTSSPAAIGEIYVRDLVAGSTVLASAGAHDLIADRPISYNHVLSEDGQYVAFESSAYSPTNAGFIQRYSLVGGYIDIVHTNAVATYAYRHFRSVDMTPDGRFITFLAGPLTNSSVCVWDALTDTTNLVSGDAGNSVQTNSVCDMPTIDSTGRYVAFLSTATNLTTNVVSGGFHLYIRDLQTATTELVDVGTNGTGPARDFLNEPQVGPDGHWIAFDCTDGNLVANDNNHAYDVFLRDRIMGSTELVSVRNATLPSQTTAGSSFEPMASASTDGRYVAFACALDGIVPGYTNAMRGICVRDLVAGTNRLASVDINGLGNANGHSTAPVISGNGRYVAFVSSATNLSVADKNKFEDVFVRDLQSDNTTLVSMNSSGTSSGNGASSSPQISANGRYVLFSSSANNLAPGSFSISNIFLRDLQSGTNIAITRTGSPCAAMSSDGRFVAFCGFPMNMVYVWDLELKKNVFTNSTASSRSLMIAVSDDGSRVAAQAASQFYLSDLVSGSNWVVNATASKLQFTADGRWLVFATPAALVADDTNGVTDVYLCDMQSRSNFLVSRGYQSPLLCGNAQSDSPTISADGRFVAFRSLADNLVPADTNRVPDIFLYDRQADITELVSASESGSRAANNRSFAPVFSGDGRTLVFQSWASDLVGRDFNQSSDLFVLRLNSTNSTAALVGEIIYAPTFGSNPVLTWQAVPGKSYRVQFKDRLTDAVWQPLNGNVTLVGDCAYANDLSPAPARRFYRIQAD